MNAWVEVDTARLADNARAFKALVGPDTWLCAVVKANAYGHGAALAAGAFLAGGADWLGVTTVAEGIELRQAGLVAPVLLLASHLPSEAAAVVEHGLVPTVASGQALEALNAAAAALSTTVEVHLLLDLGMGRDGASPAHLSDLLQAVRAAQWLRIGGLYTHFPRAAEKDQAPTLAQFERFAKATEGLEANIKRHCANSAATLNLPEARLDMVRVGTALYGQMPSAHVNRAVAVRSAWRLRANLVEVRKVSRGATIGYGSECRLARETLVGTILVGWQQGFTLAPDSLSRGWRGVRRVLRPTTPEVTLRGHRCPVLGRVSMQSCALDLSLVPDAKVGDVVDVPCRRATVDRALPRLAVAFDD